MRSGPRITRMGYLSITGLRLGLLVNFKYAKLEWKRVVR